MAEEKAKPTETGTYSVITVKGTGERGQYLRIADRLVKDSRIFRKLCKKIHEAKRAGGVQRFNKERQKGKYLGLLAEFKQFEKDCNIILRKKEKQIEALKRELGRRNETIQRNRITWNNLYKQKQIVVKTNSKIGKELSLFRNFQEFFGERLRWSATVKDGVRAEIYLRSILGYEELKEKGELTYYELILLSCGSQLAAINKQVVTTRFGEKIGASFNRQMGILIAKGFFRKFDRKQLYYITEDGRNKFEQLNKLVYSKQYGLYWQGLFTKQKE